MTRHWLLTLLMVACPVAGHAATVAEMKGARRVLVVAAPDAASPQLAAQRRALAAWREGAADRDVSTVELVGDSVIGATDAAAALRRRFALPAASFAVILIGKDGHVALRSATPLSAAQSQSAIDAMPIRRAGER